MPENSRPSARMPPYRFAPTCSGGPVAIHVALHHRTHYAFDRPTTIFPHTLRLRPAVHSRTPILSYALKVEPPITS